MATSTTNQSQSIEETPSENDVAVNTPESDSSPSPNELEDMNLQTFLYTENAEKTIQNESNQKFGLTLG